MMQRYTQNSSENESFSNIENILETTATTSSNPYDNVYIQNNIYGYNSNSAPYNKYRKDTEEILEMFTAAVKELSECERKLINQKFYDLFLNKKIKLKIEINDEEKI